MGYEEIKDFVDKQELTHILVRQLCYSCNEEDCAGCQGYKAIIEMEDLVYDFGIEYMKELALKFADPDAGAGND